MKDKETIQGILTACIGLPLLFFHDVRATAVLHCYLLTALLFGVLLRPDYPPFNTPWFWRAMLPTFFIHSALIFVIAMADIQWTSSIGEMIPARMRYGFLGVLLVVEWRLALFIIERCEPKRE